MERSSNMPQTSLQDLCGLSYPRPRINDNTLDENLPAPPTRFEITGVRRTPTASLGALDLLPVELLHIILRQSDLQSISNFRRVNRRADAILDSVQEYRALTVYARHALTGILTIETGRFITCQSLYLALCTANCELCGDFAGFLYILTCKRVCFLCLSHDERYLPLRQSHAIRKFGVNYKSLEALPRMRSIPGMYSPNRKKVRDRLTLVDFESARCSGVAAHESVTAMERYVAGPSAQELQ